MYKVLCKYQIANTNIYCIDVEGKIQFLKNGIRLKDEKGNIFVIQSVGMTKYKNIEDYKKYATLLLAGKIEDIGKNLTIIEAEI